MPWNRFVLGYHGCDESIVADVVTGKRNLQASRNDYDWLGNGIYFWEDSRKRALQWARESRRIKTPAVIGAVINLGECLNLLDVEHLETVSVAFEALKVTCERAIVPMPHNGGTDFKSRKLDCAVIETLHLLRKENELKPYETVRGFFVEGEPLYEGAGLRQQDHIQLCVCDPHCIVGYFIPRSE